MKACQKPGIKLLQKFWAFLTVWNLNGLNNVVEGPDGDANGLCSLLGTAFVVAPKCLQLERWDLNKNVYFCISRCLVA
uniref:Uncharacterized protein n=1 Tax=Lepeophtheirus salmonis TaxID=72036 RepID=A0A0K2UDR1_LEPSM